MFEPPVVLFLLATLPLLLLLFFLPVDSLVRARLRFLMTPVFNFAGLSTPCKFLNKPQALHKGLPSASLRHKGVFVVPQLRQTGPSSPAPKPSLFELRVLPSCTVAGIETLFAEEEDLDTLPVLPIETRSPVLEDVFILEPLELGFDFRTEVDFDRSTVLLEPLSSLTEISA